MDPLEVFAYWDSRRTSPNWHWHWHHVKLHVTVVIESTKNRYRPTYIAIQDLRPVCISNHNIFPLFSEAILNTPYV